eukprot:6447687-Pyramimonas_sp.AAC.1
MGFIIERITRDNGRTITNFDRVGGQRAPTAGAVSAQFLKDKSTDGLPSAVFVERASQHSRSLLSSQPPKGILTFTATRCGDRASEGHGAPPLTCHREARRLPPRVSAAACLRYLADDAEGET